jgi:hypothetical protein
VIGDLKGASMVWGRDWRRRSRVVSRFVSYFSVAHRQHHSVIAGDCDQRARVRNCRAWSGSERDGGIAGPGLERATPDRRVDGIVLDVFVVEMYIP